jgi:hypothetical protein
VFVFLGIKTTRRKERKEKEKRKKITSETRVGIVGANLFNLQDLSREGGKDQTLAEIVVALKLQYL